MKAQALCLTPWDSSPFIFGQNGTLHDSFNPPGLLDNSHPRATFYCLQARAPPEAFSLFPSSGLAY